MADGVLIVGEYEKYPDTQHGVLIVGYYGETPPTISGRLVIGRIGVDNSYFFAE